MILYYFLRKIAFKTLVALLCILVFFTHISPVFAQSAVPNFFSYQGRLTDASGNLLGGSGTTYYFKFSLWNSTTVGGGSRVWPSSTPTTVPLTVKQGLFNVNIGDVANGYPDALTADVFDTTGLYLQVEVSSNGVSFETLSPRQTISSSFFTQVSGRVKGEGQSSIGTTTPASDSILTVVSTTTGSVAVTVKGVSGQTADLLKVQNSLGNKMFAVTSTGGVLASSTVVVSGATELYSTLNVNGLTSLQNASTTLLSAQNGVYVGTTTKTIILGDNATSTFSGGITVSNGVRVTGGGVRVDGLNCSAYANGGSLTTDANGNILCADDDTGVGGSGVTSLNGLISTTQTFATSSDPNITLTITSSGSVHTFTPAFTGTLSVARGGTGISNPTSAGILVGSYGGGSYQQIATSSLGLSSTDVVEGSNLYFTNARVLSYLNTVDKGYFFGTTSADYWLTQQNISGFSTTSADYYKSVRNFFSTTSADFYESTIPRWATTSATYFLSVNRGNAFSTTSALNFLAENRGAAFSTTSADFYRSANTFFSTTSSDYFLSQRSTSNLSEGTNLYFTDARADARLNATTTLGTLQFLPSLVRSTTTSATTTNLYVASQAILADINGNVGIGTSSPFAKLSIKGLGSGTGLVFQTTDTSNTPGVSITDNGRFMLGTTTSTFPAFFVSSGSQTLTAQRDSNSTSLTSSIVSGAAVRNTDVTNNNYSSLSFLGISDTGSGLTFGQLANVMTDHTNGSTDSDFAFILRNNDTLSETFRIQGTGNVGVGTTSPVTKLAVNGLIYSGTGGFRFPDGTTQTTAAAGGGGYATIQDEGSGLTTRTVLNFTGSGVSCADNAGNTRTDCTINAGAASAAGSEGQIQFNTGGSLGANASFVYQASTGSVGIGTSSPRAALQIATSSRPQLMLSDPSAGTDLKHFYASSSQGSLSFGTVNDNLTTFTPRVTIDNQGGVGIGTTPVNSMLTIAATSSTARGLVIQTAVNQSANAITVENSFGDQVFSVGNTGGITINASTTDFSKTTTGTSKSSDFSLPGATFVNTNSNNNNISVDEGNIPVSGQGLMTLSATTTPSSIGAGSHVILREDGKYVVIHGGASTAVSVWDGGSSSMTALGVTLNANAGAGSVSLRRPDGRYLVVHGGGVNTTTILDPYGRSPSIAGPNMGGACTTGTFAFQRTDGLYVILCGGTTAVSIYNPTANTVTAGPTVGTWAAGAHAIARDNGTFLVFLGGNSTTHYIYNPISATGGWTETNPITSNAPTITTGAFSIRRTDGKFLIMGGAVNTSTIYDPTETATTTNRSAGTMTAQSGSGFGPTVALADGAQAIWRQDRTYLLFIGSGSSVTNIIDLSKSDNTQFTSGPATSASLGAGATAFMRPSGEYTVFLGGGTVINNYNIGYILGGSNTGAQPATYETECIAMPQLNSKSFLTWNVASEGKVSFQVKTGPSSCSGTYKDISSSGNFIYPNTGDAYVQVKVTFKRNLPQFLDQDWGVRKSGIVRYRRNNLDPALYDFTIHNSNLFKRTSADLSYNASSASSSQPVLLNLIAKTEGVGLSYAYVDNPEYNTTVNTANTGAAIFNGGFASSTPLLYGVASSTIVLKRPDNKFVIISGGTTTNAQLLNPDDETISELGVTPTGPIGVGALSFKRPDGNFVIVMGAGGLNSSATTTTNIYDPVANTFTRGPSLSAPAGRGALVTLLPNGKFLIVHGNFTTSTSVYDPFQNTMIAGPLTTAVVGAGSMFLPRPDGTSLLIVGTSNETCTLTTTTNIFDPYTMQFKTNPGVTIATGVGAGAFAFQRTDGLYVIVHGGGLAGSCGPTSRTAIYNPFNNRLIVGPTFTVTPSAIMRFEGNSAIPTADGNWMMLIAGATSTVRTMVYQEKTGAYTADMPGGTAIGSWVAGTTVGPWINAGGSRNNGAVNNYYHTGPGSISFQLPNGKFFVIAGAASSTASSTNTFKYDGGWVNFGTYRTEQLNIPDLDSNSVLNYKLTPSYLGVTAEVRTAATQAELQAAPAREISGPGAKINPNPGDQWIQVSFNFKRDFPSYKGVYTDVWYNGSTPVHTQRDILSPTLTEVSISKDSDFLNLQTDGVSMFRISSSGNIYAANGATINTSGADLAERYRSQVPLKAGEVVAIDPHNNHGVKKTQYQYQSDAIGVVSTDPGFVAGAYTEDSYPIALIGRVPVKVSTENGMIKTGDRLTPSSVPGYAMKATLAGRVVGKALESIDETKLEECPASDTIIPGRKCTSIMMFVNLVDYMGDSVEDSLAFKNSNTVSVSIVNGTVVGEDSVVDTTLPSDTVISVSTSTPVTRRSSILTFLEDIKSDREQRAASKSEVFADKGNFITEVISPTIVARVLSSEVVEGLSVSAQSITSRDITLATLGTGSFKIYGSPVVQVSTTTLDGDASSTPVLITTESPFLAVSFDALGNAFFAGDLVTQKITTGELFVTGSTTLQHLNVSSLGFASTSIDVFSDINFFGVPYFTKDTGGRAVIKAGATVVDIVFEREYIEKPIVNASISYEMGTSTDDALEQALLDQDIRFIISKKTHKGFVIRLQKPLTIDVEFDWIALAVHGRSLFTSRTQDPIITELETVVVPIQNTSTTTVDVPVIENTSAQNNTEASSTVDTSVSTENTTNNETSTTSVPLMEVTETVIINATGTLPVIPETTVESEAVSTTTEAVVPIVDSIIDTTSSNTPITDTVNEQTVVETSVSDAETGAVPEAPQE